MPGTLLQVKFVPLGQTVMPGALILVLRMPWDSLNTQLSVFEAFVEVNTFCHSVPMDISTNGDRAVQAMGIS